MYKRESTFLFCSITITLFIYLNYVQPYYYIDEVFHIPQTLQYCAGNFSQWNPKITTFPGLYLLTALILSPLNLCNIICIRCINLFGTFFNLYLTYNIIKTICVIHWKQKWNEWMKLTVAYNITLLPPLYFWHFAYYTDVVSVNTVLLMLLLHLRKHYKVAAFVGMLAVLVRQTNIIWVAFLTVERALDLLHYRMKKQVSIETINSTSHFKLIWKQITEEMYHGSASFLKFLIQMCASLLPYVMVCLMFVLFVIWNKGIVIGDRTAHIPTIHIPQLFYFSAFTFCFSWPYLITYWRHYVHFIQEHWILGSCFFLLLTVIVHCNTMVHPYVLADNRHYVFYFWNKFMGRYVLCKYLLIPLYSFTLYAMYLSISHLRFISQINYIFMISAVLVPQLLLEPRYFILPYIIYRLSIRKPKRWQIMMESLTTFIVNFCQFSIFINKVFYWDDEPHPQRISW